MTRQNPPRDSLFPRSPVSQKKPQLSNGFPLEATPEKGIKLKRPNRTAPTPLLVSMSLVVLPGINARIAPALPKRVGRFYQSGPLDFQSGGHPRQFHWPN